MSKKQALATVSDLATILDIDISAETDDGEFTVILGVCTDFASSSDNRLMAPILDNGRCPLWIIEKNDGFTVKIRLMAEWYVTKHESLSEALKQIGLNESFATKVLNKFNDFKNDNVHPKTPRP